MLQDNQKIIGNTKKVRLIGYSDLFIPAKVDTGADDSAIWASSIVEKDGELSFKLFSPKSIFYTGELISTSNYNFIKVKNSFGEREYRYKVYLPIEIDDEIFDVSLNLSDRSKNRYPILIGKKFLEGRFVVDVSRNDIDSEIDSKKPILILKSIIDKKTNEFMSSVQKAATSEFIISNYKSLTYRINDHNVPSILLSDGSDISIAKAVYFKSHDLYREQANAVAQYLKYKHIPFFDSEVGNFVSSSKLSEMFILTTNNIPVPKSIVVSSKKAIPSYEILKNEFGSSFVIKNIDSDRGNNNFIVKNEESHKQAIDLLQDSKGYIIQQYIENDGFIRVLIIGGKIIQIIKRSAVNHKNPLKSHLNKPAGSSNAIEMEKNDCSPEMLILARKSAMAMMRNIVGVDLIQDKTTKKWYVLEANYNPEIVGGINSAKKIDGLVKFLELKR